MSNIKHVTQAHLLLVAKYRMPTVYNAIHDNTVNIHKIVNANVGVAYSGFRDDTFAHGVSRKDIATMREIMRHVNENNVCVRLQDIVHDPEVPHVVRRQLLRVARRLLMRSITKHMLLGDTVNMSRQITTLEDTIAAQVNISYGFAGIHEALAQLGTHSKLVGILPANAGRRDVVIERTGQCVRIKLGNDIDVSFWMRHSLPDQPIQLYKVVDNKRGSVLTTYFHAINALATVNNVLRDVQAWSIQ